MAGMIFFTDNYQDRSTNDGYQFEFYCRRCGNCGTPLTGSRFCGECGTPAG